MIATLTVKHIQVMGRPKSVVIFLDCELENGEKFELQVSESLNVLKGKTQSEVKEHLLAKVGRIIKDNIESEKELVNGKWKYQDVLISKVFKIDTSLIN